MIGLRHFGRGPDDMIRARLIFGTAWGDEDGNVYVQFHDSRKRFGWLRRELAKAVDTITAVL